MLKNIKSNLFNFSFFLSGFQKVKTLKDGAIEHGGATKWDNGIYSNVEGSDFITVKPDKNELSIFIPSTTDVDIISNNSLEVEHIRNKILKKYPTNTLKYYNTEGSWYSEDLKKVVIENVTIITLTKDSLTKTDIEYFITLAQETKDRMNQEGVSLNFNGSLAIV